MDEIENLSYRELQHLCKEKGLPANGTTDDIRNRLMDVVVSPKLIVENDEDNDSPIENLSYRELQLLCKERGLPANGSTDAVRARLMDVFPQKDNVESNDNAPSIENLSYRELQQLCKKKGLPASGTTEVIRARLIDSSREKHNARNINVVSVSPPNTRKRKTQTEEENKDAEIKPESTTTPVASSKNPPKKKKKSPSPKKQRIEPGSLKPPKDWERIYSIVEELRADRDAPLDTDGGEALPERDKGLKVYRFQVLVALLLSSQTKDKVVGETMRALQKHGLTVENIHATDSKIINRLINRVGFHNNKTTYLKKVAEVLINGYDGDIPGTADEMMKLSGIGPKMAYIIESIAFGTNSGIGVDTHMHRIFNDLKWVKSKTPEQTREQLEGWLPKKLWGEVNMLWVGFGQESQQQKEKILKKALSSSRPTEALDLLKRVGVNITKEAKKYGLEDEVKNAYRN